MIRKNPWFIFALVFCWKVALFLVSVQPIPANDAFFYDGAAVHKLLYGGFYNPVLIQALPIGAMQIFSGYPPLYHLPLMAWMSVFGISAKSVIALHLVLFGCYMLVLFAVLKRLKTPAWCINLAGGFLLVITFHDRPDSLAQLLGMLAVYACIRSRRILGGNQPRPAGNNLWSWAMVLFAFLSFYSSLQIGAIYIFVVVVATAAACYFEKEKIPFAPMFTLAMLPIALIMTVRLAFPLAWAGFEEHARQTPSVTGLRIPTIPEILKIARSVPGIFLVLLLLPIAWFKRSPDFKSSPDRPHELILLPLFLVTLVIVIASLLILTPNFIGNANYLQPLMVACFLAICSNWFPGQRWLRLQVACFALAILLGSVRAIGMTTWGVACATDVGYSKSRQLIEAQLSGDSPRYTVVMSSAFLYDAVKHSNINFIHSDWMEKAGGDSRVSDMKGLLELKPRKIILTQYDYYRRFEPVLAQLKGNPALLDLQITNTAKIRPPDSYKSLQHVVQHVSWAPVIISLTWRE